MPEKPTPLAQDELRDCLAINRLRGLTRSNIKQLIENLGEISSLFLCSKERENLRLPLPLLKQIANIDWKSIDEELKWAEEKDHHLITLLDHRYPALLREINSSPILLYVIGKTDSLSQPQLAMVGSRNPTHTGQETAEQFAEYLAASGLIITSGLALGIDAASHHGALQAGNTIAVLGSGLNHIYPYRNKALAEKIAKNGTLVSEFPLSAPPRKEHFPRRNRLISGLSIGVLVIEAAIRSGSLITAQFATEQGREVFAIPGSIHNPLSKGCHYLLRQGAKLVETAQDILEELHTFRPTIPYKSEKREKPDEIRLDDDYKKLVSCVGFEPTAVDTIMLRSGLPIEQVSSMLLLLELQGYVKSTPGGYSKTTELKE